MRVFFSLIPRQSICLLLFTRHPPTPQVGRWTSREAHVEYEEWKRIWGGEMKGDNEEGGKGRGRSRRGNEEMWLRERQREWEGERGGGRGAGLPHKTEEVQVLPLCPQSLSLFVCVCVMLLSLCASLLFLCLFKLRCTSFSHILPFNRFFYSFSSVLFHKSKMNESGEIILIFSHNETAFPNKDSIQCYHFSWRLFQSFIVENNWKCFFAFSIIESKTRNYSSLFFWFICTVFYKNWRVL